METLNRTLSLRDLCQVGICTALTCVLSQIAIPLPFTPIPLSFGPVAVFFTGLLLPPKIAGLSQLCYLLLGGVGLPVFHNFLGGPAVLFGPTGGYLLAYPLMALWIAGMSRVVFPAAGFHPTVAALCTVPVLLGALFLCYFGGTLWLVLLSGTPFRQALAAGVYPFLPLDLAKVAVCAACAPQLRARLQRANLLGH